MKGKIGLAPLCLSCTLFQGLLRSENGLRPLQPQFPNEGAFEHAEQGRRSSSKGLARLGPVRHSIEREETLEPIRRLDAFRRYSIANQGGRHFAQILGSQSESRYLAVNQKARYFAQVSLSQSASVTLYAGIPQPISKGDTLPTPGPTGSQSCAPD